MLAGWVLFPFGTLPLLRYLDGPFKLECQHAPSAGIVEVALPRWFIFSQRTCLKDTVNAAYRRSGL